MQIESALRGRILCNQYAPGGAFPTDAKLCDEFKVSRATVRLAVDALRREGLIARYPGRGTFVSEWLDQAQSLRFNGSIEQIVTQGDGAGHEHLIVKRELTAASPLEAKELRLAPKQRVIRLTGFRMRERQRMGHVQISLAEATGTRLDIREGHKYSSIFRLIDERLGLKTYSVRQIISVAMPTRDMAKALDIPKRVPLLVRRRTFFGAGDVPLELSITSYPGDRYKYEVVIS